MFCDLGCCKYDDGCFVTRDVVCFPQEEWTVVFNQLTVNRISFVVGKCEYKQKNVVPKFYYV